MIEVLRKSIGCSIQDLGRFGHRNKGICIAGAMDQHALFIVNSILGNDVNMAVVECSLMGTELKFHLATNIALYGAQAKALLNGKLIKSGVSISIKKDDILTISEIINGNYIYLGVKGGICTSKILGSRSYHKFITASNHIQKADNYPYKLFNGDSLASVSVPFRSDSDTYLDCYMGPEFMALSEDLRNKILDCDYKISKDISRVGFRVTSEEQLSGFEILSSSIQAGTVQLTPSGTMIIMMRDCPITGGYSRLFQLSDQAINRLSQKSVGSTINFRLSLLT